MPVKHWRMIFWTLLAGILAFSAVFGLPIISAIAAQKVLALAGCGSPDFVSGQAACPSGSLVVRFGSLASYISSLLAPVLFVKQFWDVLLVWILVIFGVAIPSFKPRSTPVLD